MERGLNEGRRAIDAALAESRDVERLRLTYDGVYRQSVRDKLRAAEGFPLERPGRPVRREAQRTSLPLPLLRIEVVNAPVHIPQQGQQGVWLGLACMSSD